MKVRHRTSMYISERNLRRLKRKAKIFGMTPQELTILILRNYLSVIHENLEAGKAIRYQPEVINPHKLYIQISFTDYEYLLDVKKHSKISISFILTKAIATYLTRKYRSTDQFHQEIVGVYSIGMVKTDKDRIDWHVYWITMPDPEGIEEEIEEEAPT